MAEPSLVRAALPKQRRLLPRRDRCRSNGETARLDRCKNCDNLLSVVGKTVLHS